MELALWFFMGILFSCGTQAITYLSLKTSMPWYGWVMLITGALSVLFGLGWAGSSFLEGVEQSGALGLVAFCLSGIVLIAASLRLCSIKQVY